MPTCSVWAQIVNEDSWDIRVSVLLAKGYKCGVCGS